jgi:AAA domain
VGVVGSTCCAALTAEALQGNRFDVVVLDEAAQVVEPLALAPILRSGCRCTARSLQQAAFAGIMPWPPLVSIFWQHSCFGP